MSAQDPISDMLTRIRNSLAVNKKRVSMPWSRQKQALADLLVEEGYLLAAEKVEVAGTKHFDLSIRLKYFKEEPVITALKRVSRPGLRTYKGCGDLPLVDSGLGIAVVSTSKGFMSNHKAKNMGLGGEILFYVS
jgi:small subunit ribosomal protein S8